jgi:hypothetical protein
VDTASAISIGPIPAVVSLAWKAALLVGLTRNCVMLLEAEAFHSWTRCRTGHAAVSNLWI